MQELQMQCADLARTNAGFVHVLAAVAEAQPDKRLVVKAEWLAKLDPIGDGRIQLESYVNSNGDVVFRCVVAWEVGALEEGMTV